MSIKPVDMQVMLPKMSEVVKAQGTDMERQLQASQRGDINTRYMVDADLREVRTKKNAQKVNFRDQKGDEGKKRKNSRQGSGKGEGKNTANGDSLSGNTKTSQFIDIKL